MSGVLYCSDPCPQPGLRPFQAAQERILKITATGESAVVIGQQEPISAHSCDVCSPSKEGRGRVF